MFHSEIPRIPVKPSDSPVKSTIKTIGILKPEKDVWNGFLRPFPAFHLRYSATQLKCRDKRFDMLYDGTNKEKGAAA